MRGGADIAVTRFSPFTAVREDARDGAEAPCTRPHPLGIGALCGAIPADFKTSPRSSAT